jgi:hypothetical protein
VKVGFKKVSIGESLGRKEKGLFVTLGGIPSFYISYVFLIVMGVLYNFCKEKGKGTQGYLESRRDFGKTSGEQVAFVDKTECCYLRCPITLWRKRSTSKQQASKQASKQKQERRANGHLPLSFG